MEKRNSSEEEEEKELHITNWKLMIDFHSTKTATNLQAHTHTLIHFNRSFPIGEGVKLSLSLCVSANYIISNKMQKKVFIFSHEREQKEDELNTNWIQYRYVYVHLSVNECV